jgi:hypothetical protein
MTKWEAPAFGVVMAKLAELALRAERLRIAAQAKSSERVLTLLTRKTEP